MEFKQFSIDDVLYYEKNGFLYESITNKKVDIEVCQVYKKNLLKLKILK